MNFLLGFVSCFKFLRGGSCVQWSPAPCQAGCRTGHLRTWNIITDMEMICCWALHTPPGRWLNCDKLLLITSYDHDTTLWCREYKVTPKLPDVSHHSHRCHKSTRRGRVACFKLACQFSGFLQLWMFMVQMVGTVYGVLLVSTFLMCLLSSVTFIPTETNIILMNM